jgi:hypothetical protein
VFLAVLTGLIAATYVAVAAPLYNRTNTIDPWVYTGLFTNFSFTYHLFWNTYYASRLPWIVAGLVLHRALPDRAAYFVLHAFFFFGGAIALFIIVRRFLGRLPAFVAFAALIANQLYYNAETWDYVDGAVVTFLLTGFAFALTRAAGRRRVLALASGGFLVTAGVATNIFAFALAVPFAALYAAVNYGRPFIRRVALDSLAFAAGAGLLILACCLFSWHYGTHWWFLKPQIRATSAINPASYRAGNYDWVVRTPRLMAPLLLLATGAIMIRTGARSNVADRSRWRFAVGAWLYLLFCEGFYIVYELAGSAPLEYSFYESLLLPGTALTVGAVVYGAAREVRSVGLRALLVAGGVIAAVGPLYVIYLRDSIGLLGTTGSKVTLVIASATLVFAMLTSSRLLHHRVRGALAAVTVALLVFGTNYSIASTLDVFQYGDSSPSSGDVYTVGLQLVRFLRDGGFQRQTPYFWYRDADGFAFRDVQSLYFFSYTYLGVSMPRIDADFRLRERLYAPRTIVLLCAKYACHDGLHALRKHGYRFDEAASRRLASGQVAIWARVFRVHRRPD